MLLIEKLRLEYEAFLAAPENAESATIGESADDVASCLIHDCGDLDPLKRPANIQRQIDWLLDFCGRWDCAQRAQDICAQTPT